MSGCYGVAVFGGQNNNPQVNFLALFHASGGLTTDLLNKFLMHLEGKLPQPGGNFQWVLVMSQGDEREQGFLWTSLGREAPTTQLFKTQPNNVYIMNGPAPGGSRDAFAVDFGGHWGSLGDQIINPPPWSVAPGAEGLVRVGNPPGRRGCCYISSACCQHLGLPDDCEELETLRGFRPTRLVWDSNPHRPHKPVATLLKNPNCLKPTLPKSTKPLAFFTIGSECNVLTEQSHPPRNVAQTGSDGCQLDRIVSNGIQVPQSSLP